jgi:hypothetical protein
VQLQGSDWSAGRRVGAADLQRAVQLVRTIGERAEGTLPKVEHLDQAYLELASAPLAIYLAWERDHGILQVWGPGDHHQNQELVAFVNS